MFPHLYRGWFNEMTSKYPPRFLAMNFFDSDNICVYFKKQQKENVGGGGMQACESDLNN